MDLENSGIWRSLWAREENILPAAFKNKIDIKVGQAYLWACELSLPQSICVCARACVCVRACACMCVSNLCTPTRSPKINASSFIHVSTFSRTEQHIHPLPFPLLSPPLPSAFLHPSSERQWECQSKAWEMGRPGIWEKKIGVCAFSFDQKYESLRLGLLCFCLVFVSWAHGGRVGGQLRGEDGENRSKKETLHLWKFVKNGEHELMQCGRLAQFILY